MRIKIAAVFLFLFLTNSAFACEPVLPLLQLYSGTIFFAGSVIILFCAVLIKAVAFAFFEKSIPFWKAIGLMFLGNILSTLIGFSLSIGAMIPNLIIGSLILVYAVTYMPACRLVENPPWKFLKEFNGAGLALLILILYFFTFIIFTWSQGLLNDTSPLWLYWIVKVGFIYIAIFISIILTTVWEEFVIARYMVKTVANPDYFKSALKANLVTMLVIMAYAAAQMLPERMNSHNFLVMLQDIFI